MKSSSHVAALRFSAALLATALVTLPSFAQDGPVSPPAGDASSPGQSPSGSDTSAPTPPETTAPNPSETTPEVAPTTSAAPAGPPYGLTYVESQPTQARTDAPAEKPDDGKLGYHQDHFLGFAGARVGQISSSGLDAFSDSDELAQFSVGFGKTIVTAGNFSVAGLFLYDIGGHSGEARGAESDLYVHRLTLGGEARYHFMRQLFVFGRVAPGAIHSIAKINDPSAGTQTLAARNWVFATDLSAGAMFELSGFSRSQARRVNVWLTFDGGYGFAGESDLTLTADGDSGPVRAEPLDLGPLALAGPFMRFAAVLTY
jgi:hypothetical protein